MWIFVILLLLNITFIFGNETTVVGPRNMAVVVGQRMEMIWPADITQNNANEIYVWVIKRTPTSKEHQLITNRNIETNIVDKHFGRHIDKFGSVVLYVNATTLDDSGIYIKKIINGATLFSAQLIVFETEPQCSSNATLPLNATATRQEEIYVSMRCKVNFRGNLVPDIEWRRHEGHGEEYEAGRDITHLSDTVAIENANISSELTVLLTSFQISLTYSCRIYFKPTNESKVTNATNAPDYSYTWRIPVVVPSRPIHSRVGLTAVHLSVVALSIGVGLVTISVCVVFWRKFRSGSTAKAEKENGADLNTVNYENVAITENPSIGDSHATTYMELTFSTIDSPSVYARIDTAGKMPTTTRTQCPVCHTVFDMYNASS